MPKTARRLPSYLLDRYRAWRALHYEEDRAWYKRLARDGQHPRCMVVACCDSRVDAVSIFGGEPGDLFVVRNVANLVPPCENDPLKHGTSAAVEFAVTVLGVAHIMVVGHSNCGGVKACDDMCSGKAPALLEESSFIGRWIDILRPAYDRVAGVTTDDPATRLRALEMEGVLTSLRNLETFPFVREAIQNDLLTLHGLWVDIAEGQMHWFDPVDRVFRPVENRA